jgi:hypothetical protein
MSRRELGLVLALAATAGFVGGGAGRWWAAPTVLAQGGAAPELVQAQRFEVVDKEGKRRGRFDALPNGAVRLILYDGENKTRTALLVAANGTPGLQFWGPHDQVNAVYADSVTLLDSSGQPRARLAPSPGLTLYGAEGRAIWAAP